ncbi:MAG: sensor histidine kinase [Acidobacteriia bacterium]|nr:sensor histidine kinase [Terriglobia bacterium]
MSEQARAALGPAENLIGTIPRWLPAGAAAPPGARGELCYSRLLELGATVLVGLRPAPADGDLAREHEIELLRLQARLLWHYFRLQQAERRLSRRTRQRPVRSRALRQIELERQRLGQELHTSVGQQLSAIQLQTEVISSNFPAPGGPVREALDRISALTADALEQVRSISKRLHPPEWQRLTLEAALQQLWSLSGLPQRFQAELRLGPLSQEPELDAKVVLYRAAQEAISNLIRHSRATRVEAELTENNGQIILTFRDDGVGFDAGLVFSAPASVAGGIGLRSIRDEAEALGGRLVVDSGAIGTTLEVTVPLTQTEP